MKSLFGITALSFRWTTALLAEGRETSTSCVDDTSSPTGTPASSVTATEMSWPARVPGFRRRDPGGIRHAVGVGSPAAALPADRRAGNVARSHHHREHELVRALLVLERLDVADVD